MWQGQCHQDGNGTGARPRRQAAELAIAFDKASCRWTILGVAAEVNRSGERGRVLAAIASEDGTPLTLPARDHGGDGPLRPPRH